MSNDEKHKLEKDGTKPNEDWGFHAN